MKLRYNPERCKKIIFLQAEDSGAFVTTFEDFRVESVPEPVIDDIVSVTRLILT